MTLSEVEVGKDYVIKDIISDDQEMVSFLFTLGCYKGETISLVSRKKSNLVVAIKDARYNIDDDLANVILV